MHIRGHPVATYVTDREEVWYDLDDICVALAAESPFVMYSVIDLSDMTLGSQIWSNVPWTRPIPHATRLLVSHRGTARLLERYGASTDTPEPLDSLFAECETFAHAKRMCCAYQNKLDIMTSRTS
jgi:hypothetical protein